MRAMTRRRAAPTCGRPTQAGTSAQSSSSTTALTTRTATTERGSTSPSTVSIDYYVPALGWHFGIARSVRLSVPWRSCLGYRHAGCMQLSQRRPTKMCGLRTRPRTNVDPPRFLDRTAIGVGAYRLAAPGAISCLLTIFRGHCD